MAFFIRGYVPQAQMFDIAESMAESLGRGSAMSSALAAMSAPDWQ